MPPKKGTTEYVNWKNSDGYPAYVRNQSLKHVGVVFTEDHCRHISESKKGTGIGRKRPDLIEINKSAEKRVMLSIRFSGENNPMFGRTRPDTVIRNKTDAMRKVSSESKLRERNPNWLGGSSFEPYPLTFNGAFREYIRLGYTNRCFFPGCGIAPEENGQALSVHHYDYDKNSTNCVPLCNYHNFKVNYNREMWERYFTEAVYIYWNYANINWVAV